jgi:serine/threonine protein kinase
MPPVDETMSPVRSGEIVAGKYRVDRILGAGGMGVVVQANQLELDRPVALKFLLPMVLERRDFVARFAREARAAAKLQGEHLARVLDVGNLPSGEPFIVMEYLDGQDVAKVLAVRGPLPSDEAVDYVLQATEAVAEAHALGIIHRDLKPSNMFLAKRGGGPPMLKVLDFGLSKFTRSEEDNVTSDSSILGSPVYMSPEQLLSSRTVGVRTDIWSLGVVLYELLTAHPPFRSERMPELVTAILHGPPRAIDSWGISIPAGLQEIVRRCLEKNPQRRFANVAQLANALAPYSPPSSAPTIKRIAALLADAAPPAETDEVAEVPLADTVRVGLGQRTESVDGSSKSVRELSFAKTGPAQGRITRWALLGGIGATAVVLAARSIVSSPVANKSDHPLASARQPSTTSASGADSAAASASTTYVAETPPRAPPVAPSVPSSTSQQPSADRAASKTAPVETRKPAKAPSVAPKASASTSAAAPAPPSPSSLAPVPTVVDPLGRLKPL